MKNYFKLFLIVLLGLLLVGCDIDNQTEDTIYYTVTFDIDGGTLISGNLVQKVEKGQAAIVPTFEKEGYVFKKWDVSINNIQKDMTIKALYEKSSSELVYYSVSFYDAESNVISTESVLSGASANAPADPFKKSTEQYNYTFQKWDQDYNNVNKDLDIHPVYLETLVKYEVVFMSGDMMIKTEEVPYGTSATAPINPTKTSTVKYDYTFEKWDQDYSMITHDLVVTAVFKESLVEYFVVFMDGENIIKKEKVAYGGSATPPNVTPKENYTFKGWDRSYENVTSDLYIFTVWRLTGPFTVKLDLGDYTYESKLDLFYDFFKDFYLFIESHYGLDNLKSHNVNSLNDFYSLASSMEWRESDTITHTIMRGIGNLAGQYFLVRDIGGSLEDQPDTHFIGYCYKNNMHVDFIRFQIDFFAWWREDEGYTRPGNNGSDFFAEAWAPLVDLGKFFYYNENTSYVKSSRVRDCFINIPGVVSCQRLVVMKDGDSDYQLPTNLSRVGYTFMGWYDNEMFSGQAITTILSSIDKNYTLYAKWQKK